MTGLPTVTVKLDDGTGTFPYDISTYVEVGTDGGPLTITRGRGDELGEIQPGTCSLVLNNTDGRFSLGSTLINATSPIFVDNQIRVTATVGGVPKDRFTGYVQTWPVEWPGGWEKFAYARITAVDRSARLSRLESLRSIIEEEILLDGPMAYYTLGEPAESTTAGDTSGNGGPALTQGGTGTSVVFGNATGPGTDGLTAAQFAGGKYLETTTSIAVASAAASIGIFFATTEASTTTRLGVLYDSVDIQRHRLSLGLTATGEVTAVTFATSAGVPATESILSAAGFNDGSIHHAVAVFQAGAGTKLYVDGVLMATTSATFSGYTVTLDRIAAASQSAGLETVFTGTLAHEYAIASALSAVRVEAHADAGLTGFAGERSDQRIARYLAYAGVASADIVAETGVQTVPHSDITGQSVQAAIAKVNEAENGLTFVRGDSKYVIQNRRHRQAKVTADWSLVAIDIGPDTAIPTDMQQVANIGTASRAGGATQSVRNQASIDTHGQYPASYDGLLVMSDEQALDRISWQVGTHAEPEPRFNAMKVDLLAASQAFQQAAQARELGDRVGISGLPAQAPAGLGNQIIEGWTETLTATSWDMTFNTSPWDLEQAWILGNATYGVLGTTTRLGL